MTILVAHRPFPIRGPLDWTESLNPVVFEILLSKRIGVTSLIFQGHVASSVTWQFYSPYAISYWWSFGIKPLSLTVSEISNVKSNAMNWRDFDTTSSLNKGQGHSFWYQSISHITTSQFLYRLSIVTFALGRTPHRLATIHSVQTHRRQTQAASLYCSISATVLSTVG